MNLKVFDGYDQMCEEIANEISVMLKVKPSALLCIAAGHTSLGLLECLVRLYEEKEINFKNASFVAMDEWLGMSEKTLGSCGEFISSNFLEKVNFEPVNIRLFDGTTSDHETECQGVAQFIKSKSGYIDYLVLGTGMNGHLALNEPGSDFEACVRVVELDSTTKEVAQKYFSEDTHLSGGITLGIGDFAKARRSVLMVNGSHKHEILHKIIAGPVSPAIPATIITKFNNASLYCDKKAYIGQT